MFRMLAALLIGILSTITAEPVWAQPKSAAIGQLGVDVVRLKSGRTVRGAVWRRAADGSLTLIVRRDWLRKSNAEWFADVTKTSDADQIDAWTQACERLDALLADPPESARLKFFLSEELARLRKNLEAPPPESKFLWVELDAKAVAQASTPTPARQKIVLWAWAEDLADVETRDAAALQKELQRRDVNLDATPPDLSEKLPARPQEDREWAARLAIAEYTFVKEFDMQGTGDIVIPTRGGRPLNAQAVLPQLIHQQLQQQMQAVLGDLAGGRPLAVPLPPQNNRGWLPEAIRAAEKAGVRGFRVTRLDLGVEARRATVASEFIAQVAPDDWRTIWQTTEAADGSQPRPELEDRIARDPQVKAAFEAMRALGVAGDNPVQQAIRVGAATMSAQQATDQRFFEFRDRHVKRIDGPPLVIDP